MPEGKFIDLKRKPETAMISRPPKAPRGEMMYLSNANLPIDDKMLNKEQEATIKYIPREKRTTIVNGQERNSFDLEVIAIKV